jgi:hypothetical protein
MSLRKRFSEPGFAHKPNLTPLQPHENHSLSARQAFCQANHDVAFAAITTADTA